MAGACVKGVAPCDDGDDCTADSCDEQFGRCFHQLNNATAGCTAFCGGAHCAPQCPVGSQCGPDGCGGDCGAGCGPNLACRSFQCIAANYPYSCAQPAPLLPEGRPLLGEHTLHMDLATLATADEVTLSCTTYGSANDLVYAFTVPSTFAAGVGVDAWLHGLYNPDVDTILEIRRERCHDLPHTAQTAGDTAEQGDDFVCSDNSEPPGGNSARIVAKLPPGSYYLLVSTLPPYTDAPINDSPVLHTAFPIGLPANRSDAVLALRVRFVDGYVQDCRSKQCGFDGRAEMGCGVCAADSHCNTTSFQCQPIHCVADCVDRACGDDGCGGSCGNCGSGSGCAGHRCLVDTRTCHGRTPTCSAPCAANEFCASVRPSTPPSTSRCHTYPR